MPCQRLFTIILLAVLSFAQLQGQEPLVPVPSKRIALKSDIQIGMIAGGQIANEQFVYKSGVMAQFAINTSLSNRIDAGIGIGVEYLDTETILPIFLDFKAKLKPHDKSPLLGVNIGSSSGWSTYYRNFSDYEYSGGFYFSPYYSFQFEISDNLSFLLATGYIHQVGWIEFFTEYEEVYRESFAMDFLTIRAGLRF